MRQFHAKIILTMKKKWAHRNRPVHLGLYFILCNYSHRILHTFAVLLHHIQGVCQYKQRFSKNGCYCCQERDQIDSMFQQNNILEVKFILHIQCWCKNIQRFCALTYINGSWWTLCALLLLVNTLKSVWTGSCCWLYFSIVTYFLKTEYWIEDGVYFCGPPLISHSYII